MLINTSNGRLVIGRFSILPGDKLPAVPLTAEEIAGVDALKKKGLLVEKITEQPKPAAPPKPAPIPKPVHKAEKPADKPAEDKKKDGE